MVERKMKLFSFGPPQKNSLGCKVWVSWIMLLKGTSFVVMSIPNLVVNASNYSLKGIGNQCKLPRGRNSWIGQTYSPWFECNNNTKNQSRSQNMEENSQHALKKIHNNEWTYPWLKFEPKTLWKCTEVFIILNNC
jgi:hypothetical protein